MGATESLSSGGLEIRNTENIRNQIKNIINKYNIKKILDAPCGDFNWIKLIIDDWLEYIGADIVENLILKNINDYKSKNSKIKYLLLTSYETKKDELGFKNKDIQDGDFRSINLLKPPFRLPNPLLKILDRDHKDKNHSLLCYLYMYSKDQLINLYLD